MAFAGGKGTWGGGSERAEKETEGCVAHQASCFSESERERMKDVHCRTEAVYQRPIPTAIFFESLLPFLQKMKDVVGGFGELKFVGEGVL